MKERTPTQVVAALIRDKEGRLLICQRPAHKARGLLWEFPGGKVDPGESHRQALIRECLEELAVNLTVEGLYMQVDHVYPDLWVCLSLYHARLQGEEPTALEHADLRWAFPHELDHYAFCPADTEIIKRLMRGDGDEGEGRG